MTHILALIGARGRSKGVPGKNIRPMNGRPLISYAIEAALENKEKLHSTLVSTDDEQIAQISKDCGIDVPFIRPAEYATDTSSSIDFMQHAVDFVEQRDQITLDWVLLIQPTNPFVLSKDISAVIDMAINASEAVTSIVSVTEVKEHPLKSYILNEQGALQPYMAENSSETATRRQDLPDCFKRNGSIYLMRRNLLMEKNELYGDHILPYFMSSERSIDIDTQLDWDLAEFMMSRQQIN